VVVATIRALKYHGGVALADITTENVAALEAGVENLKKHIETIQAFGVPVVVAINRFASDTDQEVSWLLNFCKDHGVLSSISTGFAEGSKGTADLAEKVVAAVDQCHQAFIPTYQDQDSITEKMEKIARVVYGADGVELAKKAKNQLKRFDQLGLDSYPRV